MDLPSSLPILAPLLMPEQQSSGQYQAESGLYALWGLAKLSAFMETESLEERGHLRLLLDRLLFLGGTPLLEVPPGPVLAEDITAILEHDLASELQAVRDYTAAITALERCQDYESRSLLGKILQDEQSHVNWLETQLSLLRRLGRENWFALWV